MKVKTADNPPKNRHRGQKIAPARLPRGHATGFSAAC